jgi:hypothetical protein
MMTYSLIGIFDEMIKEHIVPFLKKQGFKKQNLNFYKAENNLKFMFNFQKNTYNSIDWVGFYINCGIYSQEVIHTIGEPVLPNPKEYECLYNVRIDHLSGAENKEFELLSSFESHKIEVANEVIRQLKKAIDFYTTIQSNDDLSDLITREYTYFWQKFFHYLAIKKDIKRIELNAKKYADSYKGDERRPFFEMEINKILVEHDVVPIRFDAA